MLDSIHSYKEGVLDAPGVQRNLDASCRALEGDVPKVIRNAICHAEAALELICFTTKDRREVERVLSDLEVVIADAGPIPGWYEL